jgi:hypothetical protein
MENNINDITVNELIFLDMTMIFIVSVLWVLTRD